MIAYYIAPKCSTDYTYWGLETIEGQSLIHRFFERTMRGFPAGDFEFFVICHEEIMPDFLRKALDGIPVHIFVSQSTTRPEAIAEAVTSNPDIQTMLLYEEGSLFPDCRWRCRC